MSPDPAVEAVMADGSWDASPLGACGVRRMVRGRVAEGLVRLVREADTAALAADREPEPVQVTNRQRVRLEDALRDWIHEQPWGECDRAEGFGWPKAYEIRDVVLAALSEPPPEGEKP